MDSVDVAGVEPDWVRRLCCHILVGEEVVWFARRARHVAAALQAKYQQVIHQAIILHHERGELQAPDNSIRVGVVHVLQHQPHVLLTTTVLT